MALLDAKPVYKPFAYPWCFEAWRIQQSLHWLPDEAPLAEDVADWRGRLTDAERHLLTQIFRFFTQADVEVGDCYMRRYAQVFEPTEVRMMLAAFANAETIHIAAYSHLLDTVGMPESDYAAFLDYAEMKAKYDYLQGFGVDDPRAIARTLAAFGGFAEGLQLFASFAILLNFPRFNRMKGMGQIVTWSVRDESLHCAAMTRLFRVLVAETPELSLAGLRDDVVGVCERMVAHEDAFIDLAFALGPVRGLASDDVKRYIRWLADRRLAQLGYGPLYGVAEPPLPWLETMLHGVEHANFFENRATEYARSAMRGDWSDAFS